jgi:hypothetical protein
LGDAAELQRHVIHNNCGFVSTAHDPKEAYYGHQYKITGDYRQVFLLRDTAKAICVLPYVKNAEIPLLWRETTTVFLNAKTVEDATLIALTPLGGVELTFITPILFEHLEYIGLKIAPPTEKGPTKQDMA